MNKYLKMDNYNHMGIEEPKVLRNFYILITLDGAFTRWQQSGDRRCQFGIYCRVLNLLGYKII